MGFEGSPSPGHVGRVGRYEVILPIAKGGMATVHLARASGLGGEDRYVALKLTAAHLRSDPAVSTGLVDEAKLVAHLRHPNVVPVYDVGECEHGVFLVMEYVPGDSFAGLSKLAHAAGAELPRRVALRILVDGLLGLHAAHEHTDEEGRPLELVHRDFSPQNILVGTDGIARLTDFGIAKATSRASSTAVGIVKGKIRYVAPEQAHGEKLDRRCDVWAAGVIAWEILAGKRLSTPDERAAVPVPTIDPPRVASVATDVPGRLDEIVAHALRVDRNERLESAQTFARELASAARTSGLLAEADEVAEHVHRLAGPELAERRARLAEAREKRRASAPDVRTMIGIGAPLAGASLPPLPDVPAAPLSIPDAPGSVLGIQVALDDDAADRASERILGGGAPNGTGAEAEEPSAPIVFRAPVVARRWVWTKPRIAVAAAIGALAVVTLLVAVVTSPSPEEPRIHEAAAATAATTATATAAGPAVAAIVAPRDVPEDAVPMLHITADGPIAKVSIGSRIIDSEVPTSTLGVDLAPEDLDKALRVVVTGTDGRVATATAAAGTRELDVVLADPPPAAPPSAPVPVRTAAATPRATPPPPQPTEKRTWPKRGPRD